MVPRLEAIRLLMPKLTILTPGLARKASVAAAPLARNPPLTVRQRRFDHFPLLLCVHAAESSERNVQLCRCAGQVGLQPGFLDRERLALAQDDRPLDDILQLANVARPGVGLQHCQGLLRNAPDLLAHLFRIALDEVL